MTSKTTYALRGVLYFLAAALPTLATTLIAAQPIFIAVTAALGAGAVAVAGYVDKTAGVRHCTSCDAENATKER